MAPRYKIYKAVETAQDTESRGQCWIGESIAENIELCEYQTIGPMLLKYLPKDGKILESGCGLGRWVFFLRQRGFDILGIDLAPQAVDAAKAYDSSAPIFFDDVLHSKYPNSHFDAAISLGVVEHFEEGPASALAELHRLLRDGGMLLISVPVQNLFRRLLTNPLKDLYRMLRMRRGVTFLFEEYRYTRKDFESCLKAAGFEIIEVVPDDFRPPKNLGLYADVRLFRSRHKKWELNALGSFVMLALNWISPWAGCSGAHWICRKLADSNFR